MELILERSLVKRKVLSLPVLLSLKCIVRHQVFKYASEKVNMHQKRQNSPKMLSNTIQLVNKSVRIQNI